MKLGIVDLDTSHPEAFIPIGRSLGHEIVGVFDGGAVHSAAYVRDFVQRLAIPHLFDSIEDMVGEVDCAMIHSCDWGRHVAKAAPFVAAGKSVFIDKPLAGNVADLRQLAAWGAGGEARITGGSALWYCDEITRYLARPESDRGTLHTVFTGCGVDLFNYADHAYASAAALLGPGAISVRHLGAGGQRRVQVNWDDGRMALLSIGEARQWLPHYMTLVSDRSVEQIVTDTSKVYESLLRATLPYLAREVDRPTVAMEHLLDAERFALAARMSWNDDDRLVRLDELNDMSVGYDGKAFAREYRLARYPGAATA